MTSAAEPVVCRPVGVPRFDVRETERVGWFGAKLDQLPGIRSDGRMG